MAVRPKLFASNGPAPGRFWRFDARGEQRGLSRRGTAALRRLADGLDGMEADGRLGVFYVTDIAMTRQGAAIADAQVRWKNYRQRKRRRET